MKSWFALKTAKFNGKVNRCGRVLKREIERERRVEALVSAG